MNRHAPRDGRGCADGQRGLSALRQYDDVTSRKTAWPMPRSLGKAPQAATATTKMF